jgi:hypothetical protein
MSYYMILLRAGLIRICKGIACLGLLASILVCFLLSYSYVTGDRHDRADMQRTFANLTRKASFIQTAQADLSSESDEELAPPHIERSLSSVHSAKNHQ